MTTTTTKRKTFCFTKRHQEEFNALCKEFGESEAAVMRRAITFLYNTIFTNNPKVRDDK